MNIMPVDIPGSHRTGTIAGYSTDEIEQILGFAANVADDPIKVSHSWGFLADGRQCGIWSYKGSERGLIFSTYGPSEVFDKLFPSKTRQNITAVVYDKRGRVLSIGKNQYLKTHPLQAKHAQAVGQHEKMFLHAEIHAIVRCKQLNKAHRILVSRWDKKGNPMLAKPCVICQSAIRAAGIKIVEHT